MAALTTYLLPFLINWLLLFVACYVIVEFAQNYLYDEATPSVGIKITLGSFLLAALLTWTRTSFATMITTDFPWTVLQAIVWFAVFTLIFRFHPLHGAVLGVTAMFLIAGTATLAVDSMKASGRPRPTIRVPSKPIRRPSSASPAALKPVDETKAAEKVPAAP